MFFSNSQYALHRHIDDNMFQAIPSHKQLIYMQFQQQIDIRKCVCACLTSLEHIECLHSPFIGIGFHWNKALLSVNNYNIKRICCTRMYDSPPRLFTISMKIQQSTNYMRKSCDRRTILCHVSKIVNVNAFTAQAFYQRCSIHHTQI